MTTPAIGPVERWRKPHLSADAVTVEKAYLARAAALEAEADGKHVPAHVAFQIAEYRALAEELHYA